MSESGSPRLVGDTASVDDAANDTLLRFALETAGLGWCSVSLVDGRSSRTPRHDQIFGYDRPPPDWSYARFIGHVVPEDRAHVEEQFQKAVAGADSWNVECRIRRVDGIERHIWSKCSMQRGADGAILRMMGVVGDQTETKNNEQALRASEARHRLLDEIGEVTRNATDPSEVMEAITRLLGEHLGVARCAYADVDPENNRFTIRHDWTAPGVVSSVGIYSLALFGSRVVAEWKRGQTVKIDDVDRELMPDDGAAMFNSIGIRSTICCSLLRSDGLRGLIAVHSAVPRIWSQAEVALVEVAAERSWAHIERVGAQAAVRESQDLLRTALDASAGGFYGIDPEGVTTLCNDTFLRMLGFERKEDVIGRKLHDVIHHSRVDGSPYPKEDCPIYLAASTGQPAHVTNEWFFRTDGRSFPVEYWSRPLIRDGEILGAVTTFIDTSERRQIEEALAHSEVSLRGLADNMSQLAWMADSNGSLFWYNQRWFDYTGTTLEAVRGSGWRAVHHPDHIERVAEKYSAHVASGTIWEDTFPLRGADGRYRWFLTRATPIRDPQGAVIRWFGTNTDITEQREASAALEASESLLRDADRRKDEFLATLAHELRNPLAPIKNTLEVLGRKRDLEVLDRSLPLLQRQVSHMMRLVDDLFEVARITHGDILLKREPLALVSVLKSAIESARPQLNTARHRFAVELPDEALRVDADPVRLSQVFINLLNNAAKYTPEGGNVWLRTRIEEGTVVISVRDSGIGIPTEMLPRVFDMFTQVDRNLRGAQDGLGIGLAIVARLVAMHGGKVEVRSDGIGEGSEFLVRLPLIETKAPIADAAGSAGVASLPSPILVVDDNRDAADSLGMLLELLGSESHVVYDGEAALALVERIHPVVALLDLGMPDMNGFDLARRIRANPLGASMHLIALTGWGQEEDRRHARDAGFDAHLVKPVDIDALQRLLESYC